MAEPLGCFPLHQGRFRYELLDTELFATVAEAQGLADRWRWE